VSRASFHQISDAHHSTPVTVKNASREWV